MARKIIIALGFLIVAEATYDLVDDMHMHRLPSGVSSFSRTLNNL